MRNGHVVLVCAYVTLEAFLLELAEYNQNEWSYPGKRTTTI